MLDHLIASLRPRVRHRAWVFSDLQQADPREAGRCLTRALDDFRSLNLPPDQLWYLGDAVEGADPAALAEMCRMQLELLGSLNAPLRYVLGNHDFDFMGAHPDTRPVRAFFHDAVCAVPSWRTTESIDSPWFFDSLGPFTILFLSDHAALDDRWWTTHGLLRGAVAAYPYTQSRYDSLRATLASAGPRVIVASHYAFPGGNRPSDLHARLLPLPPNVKLHLYGHCHIGDGVWGKQNLHRKISWIDGHDIPQCDIASLEDARGNAIRSAILEIYDDLSLGVFFRNHSLRQWDEALLLNDARGASIRAAAR